MSVYVNLQGSSFYQGDKAKINLICNTISAVMLPTCMAVDCDHGRQVKIHACAQNFRETLEFLAPPHFWCSPCVTSPQNIVRTCIFAFSMIAIAKIRDYAQFSMAGAL